MDGIPCQVAAAYEVIPEDARTLLLEVRKLIFAVAEEKSVGVLTETLKWGEPAYLTETSKAGSTIRLGLANGLPAVFLSCQTTLVDDFRTEFPEAFTYEGCRALVLADGFDRDALALCIGRALTYHRNKRVAHV